MGACCCGGESVKGGVMIRRTNVATEPLLKDGEREAVSAILTFLDGDEQGGSKALGHDKMESLRTLAYSDNPDLQKSAALCFSEISESWSEPVTVSFLRPIVHLLLSPDVDIQRASSLALSNLILRGPAENKSTVIKAESLPPLIILLRTEDAEVQCNVCSCITTLATNDFNKKEIAAQGAIPPLLVLTRSQDSRVQRNAIGALLNLTHIDSNRHDLVQAGAVPVFIQLLESTDQDVQFYCAAAISNLAVNESHRATISSYGNGKVLRVLILLMKTSSEKVQCQACLALRNLASDVPNQSKIIEFGGLEVLVPLLHSSNVDTLTGAVAALRNLSIGRGNEVPIVESGALNELRELLSLRECSEVQCHAAGTVRNLAAEDQCQAIIQSGCLLALAERLRDSVDVSGSVLSETSAALAVLASNATACKKIMSLFDENFHKVLLKLTDSPYKEVQYNCAGIIGHLAMNEEFHSALLEDSPSALDFLFKFMQSDDVTFVHLALWILAQFSNGSKKTKKLLRHSILMNKVIDLRGRRNSIEIYQLADSAFNNLEMIESFEEHC